MKQRLGIAQALLGSPELLVVDEPTAGLDPEERIRFRNLLARLSGERTVILSTHIVADVEASALALAVLNKGRIVFSGTPEDLVQRAQGQVWQIEATSQDYDMLEKRYQILSSRTAGRIMQLRVLSPENPGGDAIEPGLEDGYIAVMRSAASVSHGA